MPIDKYLDKLSTNQQMSKNSDKSIIKPHTRYRDDIENIINMNDIEFANWYFPRINATKKLLEYYELFGSIPDLNSGTDIDKPNNTLYDRARNYDFRNHLNFLRSGLIYLKMIRDLRDNLKTI